MMSVRCMKQWKHIDRVLGDKPLWYEFTSNWIILWGNVRYVDRVRTQQLYNTINLNFIYLCYKKSFWDCSDTQPTKKEKEKKRREGVVQLLQEDGDKEEMKSLRGKRSVDLMENHTTTQTERD